MKPLRNFFYINTQLLDDYISAIDGYSYDEESRVEQQETVKSGSVKGGLPVISGTGQIESSENVNVTKKVKITDAAKFQRLCDYLSEDDELPYYEFLTSETWDNIHRENFIEVLVSVRFSKMQELLKTAQDLSALADSMQSLTDEQLIDSKSKAAIEGLSVLTNSNNGNEISCVFSFVENKDFPMVAYLDKQYFRVPESQFIGQFSMLCKVQRKIPMGQKIDLDEIFQKFKNLPLNREQRRKMPKNMNNPKEVRDTIKGPAMVVIPVAIYQ